MCMHVISTRPIFGAAVIFPCSMNHERRPERILERKYDQARKRCIELSESVTFLREDYRKANRTLDKLAADGVIVEIPPDKNAAG